MFYDGHIFPRQMCIKFFYILKEDTTLNQTRSLKFRLDHQTKGNWVRFLYTAWTLWICEVKNSAVLICYLRKPKKKKKSATLSQMMTYWLELLSYRQIQISRQNNQTGEI